jgi:hypothetical protein
VPRWGGPVLVEARAPGYLPARTEAGPEGTLTLRLPALPRSERLRLSLVDAAGRVVSPAEVPAQATVIVRAFGPAVDEARRATWALPARAALAGGLDLPTGTVDLSLWAPGWVPAWHRVVLPGPATVPVPVPPRARQPFVAEVVDAASGEGIAGALVRYGGWGEGQVRTDAAGRLEIPYLPGEELPDDVALDWESAGWVRARFAVPRTGADGSVVWRLAMHAARAAPVSVQEADGRPVDVGVAWSTGERWPTLRRRIRGGLARVPLPAGPGEDGDLRYAFASTEGFAVVDAAGIRAGEAVALKSWQPVRLRIDRAGEPCPGTCQVGVHLLGEALLGALEPTGLAPWAWTTDISAAGVVDAVVPADEGCVLQVDVGRRTAFFRASALWGDEERTVRVGPETESGPRTFFVRTANGEGVPGADVELRWFSPRGRPRPLDLVFRGRTDADGAFRHYGPHGPYVVVVTNGGDLHAPNYELGYDASGEAELRVPAGE